MALSVKIMDGSTIPLADFGRGLPTGTSVLADNGERYTLTDPDSSAIDHDDVEAVTGQASARWLKGVPGDFAADTIIPLGNSAGADVDALEIETTLTDDTAASEDSQVDFSILTAGAVVRALRLLGQGIVLQTGDASNPALKIGTQPFAEISSNLRLGLRLHYLTNDVFLLNPFVAANAQFALDTGSTAGVVFTTGGAALRGASLNGVVALASGAQLWGFGTTGGAVTALKAVGINSSGAIIAADNTTPTNCLGITIAGQAGTGAIAFVVRGLAPGVLSGATVGATYYLGASGAVTATKPASGRLIRLGTAVSATDLHVAIVDGGWADPLITTAFAGHNGAGAITLTGTRVGDLVKSVTRSGTGGDSRSLFEATITVNDQIQQSDATNLSGNTYLPIIQRLG